MQRREREACRFQTRLRALDAPVPDRQVLYALLRSPWPQGTGHPAAFLSTRGSRVDLVHQVPGWWGTYLRPWSCSGALSDDAGRGPWSSPPANPGVLHMTRARSQAGLGALPGPAVHSPWLVVCTLLLLFVLSRTPTGPGVRCRPHGTYHRGGRPAARPPAPSGSGRPGRGLLVVRLLSTPVLGSGRAQGSCSSSAWQRPHDGMSLPAETESSCGLGAAHLVKRALPTSSPLYILVRAPGDQGASTAGHT